MSIAACAIAIQTSGPRSQPNNPPYAWYLFFAILVVIMALIVFIFIHTTARRFPKR